MAKTPVPVATLVLAWLIPGGGHLWLHRWGRGFLLMGSITTLFALGMMMGGRLFQLTPSNMVETLGFLGDLCGGLLFFGAKFFGYDVPVSASPTADYGTKFLLVAGLLNVLCILDAYDIAVGNKD
ncbi:MAG: hypothetical protein HY647_03280 [Acidobacteria bacterium]|nr:hypothetical protein [Acidobacteriota bacterium]